ncbi:DUF4172 domain-containing protein [Pseudomonas sp. MWU13-2105]|uniref:DUF4172 domain-containing protein n=1 Tax=Pseudomonas sp. MWU13-2105 TaxID=2935074 RepID=UPI00399A3583
MNDLRHWIWQQPDGPHFTWQEKALTPLLLKCVYAQRRLLGMTAAIGPATRFPACAALPPDKEYNSKGIFHGF